MPARAGKDLGALTITRGYADDLDIVEDLDRLDNRARRDGGGAEQADAKRHPINS